jgi:hypothetical protein
VALKQALTGYREPAGAERRWFDGGRAIKDSKEEKRHLDS